MSNTEKPAISVKGISKRYWLDRDHQAEKGWRSWLPWNISSRKQGKEFWALRDISFDLQPGERIGIIGRNGAGKSTLLKVLARLIYPTEGEARVRGRVAALLEVGTGMNEQLTGRQNVELLGAIRGMTSAEVADRYDEIVEFSGLGEFINEPIRAYSSGMRSRLAFAVAAHLDSDILILDEVLAVGDMSFARKCLAKVKGLTSSGRTVIFVSHGISDVVKFCDRAIWLEHGKVALDGPVQKVAEAYTSSVMELVAETPIESKTPRPDSAATIESSIPDPDRLGAEFVAFRIVDEEGRPKTAFTRSESIHLEIKFRVLRSDIDLVPTLHVYQDEVHVFSSHPPVPEKLMEGEEYQADVTIPAALMNAAIYHFSAEIVSPVRPVLRHAELPRAVSCSVFDQIKGDEIFSGTYRGVVRPDLPWQVSNLTRP